jgi:hypothetical protein
MFKSLIFGSLLAISLNSFAQDMSQTEDTETAYTTRSDGTSLYVGRCSTHEDYETHFYQIKKTIQNTIEPAEVSSETLKKAMARFDQAMLETLVQRLGLREIAGANSSLLEIFQEMVDDFTVETISLSNQSLDLIRFNVGIGGGNGAYVVFKQEAKGQHRLISHTMDSDLLFCDRSVWMFE